MNFGRLARFHHARSSLVHGEVVEGRLACAVRLILVGVVATFTEQGAERVGVVAE